MAENNIIVYSDSEDDSSDRDSYYDHSRLRDPDDLDDTFEYELIYLRQTFNLNYAEGRSGFFDAFTSLVEDWVEGQSVNLRRIFRREEMDWILTEYVKKSQERSEYISLGPTIADFVIQTGYKDEPDTDEVDKPLPRRTTPLHYAARCSNFWAVRDLFKIYNRYDVNFADEFGYTHFHAACEFGRYKIVKEFLQFGQDSNLLVQETGDTPLHLAVSCGERKVIKLLLRNGANPSSVNAKGSTPLHRFFRGPLRTDDDLAEIFFRISDEKHLTVQVDARNNEGQTALQLAVANFMPNTVEVLLDRGADLSNFVFPAEKYFYNCNDAIKDEGYGFEAWYKSLRLRALSVVKCLEKRGYKQKRSDALKLMKFFAEHLCETMSRGFFQPWALESLLVLTRHELPILCCEKIIEKLVNVDMLKLCLAADIVTNESSENM